MIVTPVDTTFRMSLWTRYVSVGAVWKSDCSNFTVSARDNSITCFHTFQIGIRDVDEISDLRVSVLQATVELITHSEWMIRNSFKLLPLICVPSITWNLIYVFKGACSNPIGFLKKKLLQFCYHKNSYIFLIIILKFSRPYSLSFGRKHQKRTYFIDYGGNHYIKL